MLKEVYHPSIWSMERELSTPCIINANMILSIPYITVGTFIFGYQSRALVDNLSGSCIPDYKAYPNGASGRN